MAQLNELVAKDPIRGAVWGISGSGKTSLLGLMAMFEEFRPIYFFDFDRRIAALRAVVPQEYWQYIHADTYQDTRVQGESWAFMEAKLARLEQEGYRTAVLDSMTFALEAAMNRVLMLDGAKSPTFTPQLQHYMQQQSMFKDVIGKFCSRKFNFFCTFHEGTDKDELTGRLFKAFAITGKLQERAPNYFNEVWHTEVNQISGQEPQYTVRTKSDMTYMARTTIKGLKGVELQQDIWPKVAAYLRGLQTPAEEVLANKVMQAIK